jgi:hypothetical protein
MRLGDKAIPPVPGKPTIGQRVAGIGFGMLGLILEGISARGQAIGPKHERWGR